MKKIAYIILFLPVFLYSQPSWQWSKHLGSNYSSYAERTNSVISDGMNTYVIGSYGGTMSIAGGSNLTASGINDIFIVKYDPSGNVVWEKTIGSSFTQPYAYEDAMGVYDPVNNCIYIAGEIVGTAAFPPFTLNGNQDNEDIFIARMNLNGTFIWAKTMGYPGSFGTGNDNRANVFIEPDGDVFLTGLLTGTSNFDSFSVPSGGFFARYDSNGNCKWADHKYSSKMFIRASFIGTDIILAGNYVNNPSYLDTANLIPKGSYDGFVSRTDSGGKIIWIKTFGNTGIDGISAVNVDSAGNIYVGGYFKDTITIGSTVVSNPTEDILVSKLDQSGNVLWIKHSSATGSTFKDVNTLISDSSGNCYILGTYSGTASFGTYNLSTTNSSEMFIGRFDTNGTWLGVTSFGDASGMGLAVDNSGSVYCSGVFDSTVNIGSTTFTSYDPQDIFFAKLGAITGINRSHIFVSQNQLIIFANPNKGTFNIKVPEEVHDLTGATLVVNDNTGKEVTRFELGGVNNNSTPHFDVTNAAEGAYTVKLITKEKKTYIGKLVVE